jgi:hypothetical protein
MKTANAIYTQALNSPIEIRIENSLFYESGFRNRISPFVLKGVERNDDLSFANPNELREHLATLYDSDRDAYYRAMRNEINLLNADANECRVNIKKYESESKYERRADIGESFRFVSFISLNALELSPVLSAIASRMFIRDENEYTDASSILGEYIAITDYLIKRPLPSRAKEALTLTSERSEAILKSLLRPACILIDANGVWLKYRVKHSVFQRTQAATVEIDECESELLTKQDWKFIDELNKLSEQSNAQSNKQSKGDDTNV